MQILVLHCRWGQIEPLTVTLYDRGTVGLEEIELPQGLYELRAYFEERFDASEIPGFQHWEESIEAAPQEWQSNWQPVAVGHTLWLSPAWLDEPLPQGRVRVNFHPGQGSGTALSIPTLLMLHAMEEILAEEPLAAGAFADIGTGSGILLAAAHALGARRLFGCDIDQAALANAAEALQADGVKVGLWCGSPRSLASNSMALVAANINPVQLIELRPELHRILAAYATPAARLVIGGFTHRNRRQIEAAYGPPSRTFEREGWLCFLYVPDQVFEPAA